jgi:hypothetical protein
VHALLTISSTILQESNDLSVASLNIGTHIDEPENDSRLYYNSTTIPPTAVVHPLLNNTISSCSSFEHLAQVYPTLEVEPSSFFAETRDAPLLADPALNEQSNISRSISNYDFVFEASAPPLHSFMDPQLTRTSADEITSYQLHLHKQLSPLSEENLLRVYENSELKSHIRVVEEVALFPFVVLPSNFSLSSSSETALTVQ